MAEDAAGRRQSLATLKTISYRISTTSKNTLPLVASQITTLLQACRPIFWPSHPGAKTDSITLTVLHKYYTQISTLLAAKTPSERWTAVVLIKATVELSNLKDLDKLAVWVRGLLAILGKQDPISTKKACVLTLTRIFMLTHDSSVLIREITTPSLPPLITASLKLLDDQLHHEVKIPQHLKGLILDCFRQLLPHHPTIFRTFASRIQIVAISQVFPAAISNSDSPVAQHTIPSISIDQQKVAGTVIVLLSGCAPKPDVARQWSTSMISVLDEMYRTATRLFLEGGEALKLDVSNDQTNGESENNKTASHVFYGTTLPSWTGIYDGVERLIGLFSLLQCYLETPTPTAVALPAGRLYELFDKLLTIIVSFSADSQGQKSEIQHHVSREDRQSFMSCLPRIHAAVMELGRTFCLRFQHCCKPFVLPMLDRVEWVFRHEKSHPQIRAATYRLAQVLINEAGPCFTKDIVRQLHGIMRACCADLEVPEQPKKDDQFTIQQVSDRSKKTAPSDSSGNAQASSALRTAPVSKAVYVTAYDFLPSALANLRSNYIPQPLRSAMDRVAVLTAHEPALLASVINPPFDNGSGKAPSSVLPLLAQAYPNSMHTETLLRPRMPVVLTGGSSNDRGANGIQDVSDSESEGGNSPPYEEYGEEDPSSTENAEKKEKEQHESMGDTADLANPNSIPAFLSKQTQPATDHIAESSLALHHLKRAPSASPIELQTEASTTKRARLAEATETEPHHPQIQDAALSTPQSAELNAASPNPANRETLVGQYDDQDADSDASFEIPPLRFANESSSDEEEGGDSGAKDKGGGGW